VKNLSKVYAVTSLLFLMVLAISPLKDQFRGWRKYQKQYNRLLEKQPIRIKPTPTGLKQIWNPELDRVDRCPSCHLGLKEATMKNAPEPFRTHPRIAHDFDEIGCTICHKGQGLATEFPASIGKVEYWDQPILPREFLEASCGTCHKESQVPEADVLSRGRRLIEEYRCVACHKIVGFDKASAPSLDGIGTKTTRGWLVRWLQNPKALQPRTKMPDFLLSGDEIQILADFLASFKALPNGRTLEPLPKEFNPTDESLIALGGTRFREARCISCHSINERGGKLAPDLGKVASKVSAQWLYNYLKNPKALQPGVQMPRYGFSEKELAAVTAYMMSEFVDYEAPPEDTTAAYPREPNYFEKGLKLFRKYNCGGCHELSGVAKTLEMGPELTYVGSKKLYEIDFGKSTIERTLPAYLYAKLQTPRVFLDNLRMPDYHFTPEERQALTTALLSLTSEEVPEKYKVPKEAKSNYRPQGAFGRIVEKYSCLACHRIQGVGGTIAPDLSRVGSQFQRKWLEDYFKVPYSRRPIVEERMPNLFMSAAEIKTVVDYFTQVLVDDEIDRLQLSLEGPPPVAEGQRLYSEKYSCQACHQLGGKGGYVGPPLDGAGSRLTSGWIYSWLMNPQKYVPETLEPKTGLTDPEARAITAYLMSLK